MRPTLIIDWQALLSDDPDQAPATSSRLARDVIPALRMVQGFGYQLRLLPPCLEDSKTNICDLWSWAQSLLSSQGIVLEETWANSTDLPLKPATDWVLEILRREVVKPTIKIRGNPSSVIGSSVLAQKLATILQLQLLEAPPWMTTAQHLCISPRMGQRFRKTKETTLEIQVNLDGRPEDSRVATGLGFFDHMLSQISRHGGFEMIVNATGDLEVDEHHLVEDTALALGAAINEALGDLRSTARYGFILPMDESLAFCAIDLGGRPHLEFRGDCFVPERGSIQGSVGHLSLEMIPHFFHSLSQSLKATIHLGVKGTNRHHQVEALFKAFGRALGQGIKREHRLSPPTETLGQKDAGDQWSLFCAEVGWSTGVPSTKGSLREENQNQ